LDLEARDGIEPPIKVLLTFALSLGDRAPEETTASPAPVRTEEYSWRPAGSHKEFLVFWPGIPRRPDVLFIGDPLRSL
jgi:hypothetical protein